MIKCNGIVFLQRCTKGCILRVFCVRICSTAIRCSGPRSCHHAEACGDDRPTRNDGKRTELGTASVFAVLSIPRIPSVLIRDQITNLGSMIALFCLPGPVRVAVQVERPDLRQRMRRAGILIILRRKVRVFTFTISSCLYRELDSTIMVMKSA